MQKRHARVPTEDLRLHPERRLCSVVDDRSLRPEPLLPAAEMGVRVVDDCAEDHRQ